MSTTTTVFRHVQQLAPDDLTGRKRDELLEIARRWHQARDAYITTYSGPRHLVEVLGSSRRLREKQRATGWAEVKLTTHYHQTAFLSAIQLLRAEWGIALAAASRVVSRDPSLDAHDLQWMRTALRDPETVEAALLAKHRPSRLHRKLARAVTRSRHPRQKARSRAWFDLDGALYRPFERHEDRHYRGAWLAITGLELGKRVRVPLRGRSLSMFTARDGRMTAPNVRVVIGERVSFHGREWIAVTSRDSGVDCGVDKGIRALLTVSRGSPESARAYGHDAGQLIQDVTAAADERVRYRRALVAYERSIRNARPISARRIQRNKLRRKKLSRANHRSRRTLQGPIGAAVNAVFRDGADIRRMNVERLHWAGARSPWRSVNRMLGRWMKGYLHRRLVEAAELNGVELNVVNAAYTSQTCPRCWFTSRENRHDERFECAQCGYTGSADAVAATNVLTRGSDPAVTRYMSHVDVKRILDGRSRSARTGRAWGSNEGVPRGDVRADAHSGESREQQVGGARRRGAEAGLSTSTGIELARITRAGS